MAALLAAAGAETAEPWVIAQPVAVTEPMAWRAWTLRVVLTDALGRSLTGLTEVPAVTRVRRRLGR